MRQAIRLLQRGRQTPRTEDPGQDDVLQPETTKEDAGVVGDSINPAIPVDDDTQLAEYDELFESLETFVHLNRCFTVTEVVESSGTETSGMREARQKIGVDPRFVNLGSPSDGENYFVPEAVLFRWFIGLNLRLARADKSRLSWRQTTVALSSLRMDGQWSNLPAEVIDFGKRLGLVVTALAPDVLVFPLAHAVSCLSSLDTGTAGMLLKSLEDSEQRGAAISQSEWDSVQSGLSQFKARTAEIVAVREGLTPGGSETLEQLGNRMGLTRERIRQLERNFWASLDPSSDQLDIRHTQRRTKLVRPFLMAFLFGLMGRGGSLLVDMCSPGANLTVFLAKCLGVQFCKLEDINISLLGTPPEYKRSLDAIGFPDSIDQEQIAKQLDSDETICLSDHDIGVLADRVASLSVRRLDKGQRVHLALRSIGKPTHFSEVTEAYNVMFPDDDSTERSIHAVLGREQYGVVWIGVKGTFALKEWGFERPTQTLFETVTEIVSERYRETGMPVPAAFISAELGKYRQIVNSNSLFFATRLNPELRVTLGEAFVPVRLLETKGITPSGIEPASVFGQAMPISSFPAALIAGPELLGQVRSRVVSLQDRFSVSDVRTLIDTGVGHPQLADLFNSPDRLKHADTAINRLSAAVETWNSGQRRDPKVTWIVPDVFLTRELLPTGDKERQFWAILGRADHRLLQSLSPDSGAQRWLPFLSMELLYEMKRMRSGDRSILQKMMLKASRDAGGIEVRGPWEAKFPRHLSSQCVFSLYRFEPTPRALALLTRLKAIHLSNVGHLTAFHPEAWHLVRSLDHEVWTKLTIDFNRTT